MLLTGIPPKFNIPFANSAGAGFTRPIPQASQIGIQAGAASLTDGFPPVCFLPIGAGGTPPWGADFNGLLNQISAWSQWVAAGGPVPYDGTFQTAIGGYPQGALIDSATALGTLWFSTADNNLNNPDAGGANWLPLSLNGGTLTTGDWKWRPTQETLAGWVKANGTTIGNAASGATQLAGASAGPLFSYLWANFSNSQCPVSGGRGASAAADFAASKTIQVLGSQGLFQIGMDTMGGAPTTFLTGVPVTSGAGTQAASILGENFHALIIAELAAHGHTLNDPGHTHVLVDPGHTHLLTGSGTGSYVVGQGTNAFGAGVGTAPANPANAAILLNGTGMSMNGAFTGITVANTGSGNGHNTVSRTMTGTFYLKL